MKNTTPYAVTVTSITKVSVYSGFSIRIRFGNATCNYKHRNQTYNLLKFFLGVSWTMIYDTIYAHQDKFDDIVLGIKSTALKFGDNTKTWLSVFSSTMTSSLLATGYVCDQTWPYYSAVALVALHLTRQIVTLDINNAEDCAKKFVSNRRIGLVLFLGIVLGTYMKDPSNTSQLMMTTAGSIAALSNNS